MGSFVGRGNQYIQFVKLLYCNLSTINTQLPTFPHKVRGLNHSPQRWEASVLPLHHRAICIQVSVSVNLQIVIHIVREDVITNLSHHSKYCSLLYVFDITSFAEMKKVCIFLHHSFITGVFKHNIQLY